MWRYHRAIPDDVRAILKKELALIAKMEIAPYFLTVHDIVQFARTAEPPILCQGRGSAANSAVCYMLGITSIDPVQMDLLFERFVSEERKEPPDIDVDFEHERREEVIQYIYRRYGRHRAALAATVIHYRPRSAVREVAKVFGLTDDIAADLASGVWGSWGGDLSDAQVRQGRLDPLNLLIARVVRCTRELIGFPRHLSQHVGGFVLTNDRLDECVPVSPATMEDRHFIEWDKDDIDAVHDDEGRCAGARHAHLHPQGVRSHQDARRPYLRSRQRAAGTSRTFTRCSRRPTPSACSRSRAARR